VACSTTSGLSRRGPQIGLVHLDSTGKPVSSGSYHCPTHFMEPSPRGLVASQAQHTLQSKGARPVLLAARPPDCPKPLGKGGSGVLKYRSGGDRDLEAALATRPKPSGCPPTLSSLASRARYSLRPPNLKQVLPTGSIRGEAALQFVKGPGEVFHAFGY
jgi:hypothetical protein